ncbi:hypothetical protein QBC47DRAFT_57529 [Echria macrotheca]|uniref:Involucrin repeat protein n=1 Tax=Echria macrotheca TaxID=438768 RepID=A0AAJ0F2J7_9PEZI|nr:hypothetical protein QBC47DRAFT_57529 [Echria macrotheca]
MREPRRRSPESSRRRRADRRHSREQLAAAAAAAVVAAPTHQPSQASLRSRADSSTSASSSTSSSLLNISRKSRFGIRSFFTRASSKKRVRKRPSFRKSNSSSSSFDDDLAYGRGYISRSSLDRPPSHHQQHPQQPHAGHPVQHPQHAPHHQQYPHRPPNDEPLFGPDGRPRLDRAQTDEEIRRIGRQLSDLAKAQNDEDLWRIGKTRPGKAAKLMTAATVLSNFDRHGKHASGSRGIASSRPRESDDEDWESASDDESSSDGDVDSGLAYGSVPHLPNRYLPPSVAPLPGQPSIISEPPAEAIRPPDRKSSAVDPRLFGPVNSLHGYINTPCGYRPGELPPQRQPTLQEPILQTGSASMEARPMRQVYPVTTGDPNTFDAAASSSGVSIPQITRDSYGRPGPPSGYAPSAVSIPVSVPASQVSGEAAYYSRPAPVPIQAPIPRNPVSPHVLEKRHAAVERTGSPTRRSRRSSDGTSLVESVAPILAGAAGAAGVAVVADQLRKRDDGRDDLRDRDQKSIREGKRVQARDETSYDRRDEKRRDERPVDTRYEKRDVRDTRYEDVREPKYESRNDGRSRVESEVKYASVSETKDRREERRERSDRPEKRDERPYETRQEKTYTQREERVYDDRDQKVYDKREKTYEKREDRPSKRDDRPPERRDERAYEKREEKIYDKRDDDRSSRKSDEKSLAQSVASVAAPALIGAAGAAILADRKEKHDDKRESEARAREDREREERRIRDDREREERRLREQHEKELRDKEEKRRLEEERLEKEARKLREDNAWREEAERRVRAEREVRYKEERISQVARERAERDRALMLRQEKLAREERRKLEAEAGKQAPRDTSGDRRLKREDVTIVYDGDAARSVAATSVAASSVAAASVVAASAVAAGAVAASEKSSSSKSSKKRESKTSSNSLGPKQAEKIPGKLSKEERRAQRDETRRMLAEIQKELEREQERAKLHQEMLAKEQDVAKETPAESSKRASTTSSKGSKGPIDPFQFQVETDAFPTPIYGTTPQRPLTPAVVTAEPKFEEEDDSEDDIAKRKSRRDAYEEARRRARIRAGQDPDAPDTPDSPVNVRDGLPSSDEPDRKREAEPVRDPIQEEADRIYRAKKMEAKIVEEEIRSRSASPEPSVVGKWNEEVEEPVVRIVTPPEMKRAPKKSKYDGPNADVRIDNVIMPRDLDRYTAPITTFPGGPTLKPVFKSRDPSAERERPMLNLVLPTPRHTPSPEKQRDRQPTTDRKDVQVVTVGPPESDDEGSAKKKSVVPSEPSEPVNDDDAEREAKAVAAIRRAFQKPAKKGINWGMITGALAGASAAAAASKEEEKSREIPTDTGSKPTTEEKPAAQSEAQSKPEPAPAPEPSRVETISSPRALPVDLDDAPPPQVGPKPSSPIAASKEKSVAVEQEATPTPRDVFVDSKEFPASTADVTPAVVDEPSKSSSPEIKMPGAFGEDKDFIATVAAGLEHSGFDPNKVIEDPAFHRRDSPPGSNDDESFYKPPSAETVTDLGVDGPSTGSRGAKNVAPADDWETPTKSSKKERRKASKRQDSRDTETTSRSEPLPLIEDRPREVEPSDNVSRDVDATKDNEPERKLTKKEQRKRDKAAKALAQDEPETFAPPETKTSLDAGDDEWAETPSKKGKKGKKGKQQSVPDAPEESSRSVEAPAITDTPIVAEPEEEWATEEPKKSKKKSKRDSATYDDSSTTYSGPASEISVASSKKSKKGKRKGTKDDYTILEQNEPPDRPGESFQVIDREISSVVSDPISKRSNGSHADDADDGKSAVSVPTSFDRKRSGKQSDGESSFEIVTPTNGTFEHKDDSKMGKENGSNSFLASAGTFGAGVGTVGATVAAIATELSLPKATPASAEEEEEEQKANPQQHQRERSVSYGSQVVDPEIVVQRVIKPAIDPQFGDLLPLPPSEPGSPYLPLEDELPELPESRPDTPPEERRAATAKTHARRRSAFETPVKTRSETAVPIQFRLGGKSVPSLPAFFGGRTSSPGALSSPVPFQTCEITPGTPSGKNRSRPTSWDSSREIKPLYLIEKTSSSSLGAEFKQDQLPELPPSDPPSRESPAPESDDERRERNFDRGFARGLMIDIPAALEGMSEDVLGSQEATPRAATFATSLAEPAEIISAKDPGAVGLLEPAEIVPREPVAKESPDTPPAGMSSTEPIHVAEALATVPASLDGQNGPSTPEAASRGILVEEPGPDVSAPSAPVSDITTKETTPTSEPARQIDEDLSKLPALPDSPQVSSVQIPATEPLLSEKELSDLPPLPASRSSSLAADLPRFSEPETEKTATDLPPLPESRSSSLATDIPRIVTPSNDVPSLAEEQTLVASFSQQPASEIPESYEDLKASLKKQALSDSASHESERNNALFAAGAAAAAGGIVVAHMLQDDTPRDLGDIELDKSRLLAPQKAESVYSADDAFDNASTIAASEAPTTYSLLSGTTFLGRDESWSKTRESPRLDRFAFVPPQAKKTLAEATIPEIPAEQSESREGEEESEWAASGFSRRSKKGKGKSTEFAPADVKEEVHSLPAEERSLQRSTSTLKKGKKKKGKKEVTWTEPAEPEQIEVCFHVFRESNQSIVCG